CCPFVCVGFLQVLWFPATHFTVFLCSRFAGLSSCFCREFLFVNMKLSWTDAERFCKEMIDPYHLFSIQNLKEMNNIVKLAKYFVPMILWIGLFSDSWKWSDLEVSSFLNWRLGQPDNTLLYEQCAVVDLMLIDSGSWEDQLCNALSCSSHQSF
uniref:C-type lectin domain-containing protein n=1 Tax=Scleropages formosus TaxID=113540 RepID=A0A8C9S1I9_SCLFO